MEQRGILSEGQKSFPEEMTLSFQHEEKRRLGRGEDKGPRGPRNKEARGAGQT